MINKKIFLIGDLFVLYDIMLWNISFPGRHFVAFYGLWQKKKNCCQPWWLSFGTHCLISQFQENAISLNFLANAVLLYRAIYRKASRSNWKPYKGQFNLSETNWRLCATFLFTERYKYFHGSLLHVHSSGWMAI